MIEVKSVSSNGLSEEIVDERIQLAWSRAIKDESVLESYKKQINIFKLLEDSLTTDEQRRLLNDLDSSWNLAEALTKDYIYRQGVKDGLMFYGD